jgi:hypothetical protein
MFYQKNLVRGEFKVCWSPAFMNFGHALGSDMEKPMGEGKDASMLNVPYLRLYEFL